jgi:hypothetical protein
MCNVVSVLNDLFAFTLCHVATCNVVSVLKELSAFFYNSCAVQLTSHTYNVVL